MAKISFDGWKDPARRPRYIIWTGAVLLVGLAVFLVTLGITSSYWFCANGCHKVQDDTIAAYDMSSHSEVSCMACHMPVNANPAVFMLHKVEALGELYLTVTNKFELPLNAESEVALHEMTEQHCTQCHNLTNRPVTPSAGVLIDHEVHAEEEIRCSLCHNRVAHPEENLEFVLNDPTTGEKNHPHEQFMSMTACFRCHWLTDQDRPSEFQAPGECSVCHPKDFDLKPPSHKEKGWFPEGHTKAADEASETVAEANKEAEAGGEAAAAEEGPKLLKVSQINECDTCHTDTFCTNCHGVPMPHSEAFKKPQAPDDPEGHPVVAAKKPETCARCHPGQQDFCNTCHHGSAMNVKYDTKIPWLRAHPGIVKQVGASACFECHDPTYCANCHVNLAKRGLLGN